MVLFGVGVGRSANNSVKLLWVVKRHPMVVATKSWQFGARSCRGGGRSRLRESRTGGKRVFDGLFGLCLRCDEHRGKKQARQSSTYHSRNTTHSICVVVAHEECKKFNSMRSAQCSRGHLSWQDFFVFPHVAITLRMRFF